MSAVFAYRSDGGRIRLLGARSASRQDGEADEERLVAGEGARVRHGTPVLAVDVAAAVHRHLAHGGHAVEGGRRATAVPRREREVVLVVEPRDDRPALARPLVSPARFVRVIDRPDSRPLPI